MGLPTRPNILPTLIPNTDFWGNPFAPGYAGDATP